MDVKGIGGRGQRGVVDALFYPVPFYFVSCVSLQPAGMVAFCMRLQ